MNVTLRVDGGIGAASDVGATSLVKNTGGGVMIYGNGSLATSAANQTIVEATASLSLFGSLALSALAGQTALKVDGASASLVAKDIVVLGQSETATPVNIVQCTSARLIGISVRGRIAIGSSANKVMLFGCSGSGVDDSGSSTLNYGWQPYLDASIASITAKLPSKSYLAGTDNADGDIQLNEATGALSAAALANAPTGVQYSVTAPAVGSAREVHFEWQRKAAVSCSLEALSNQTGKAHALIARVPGGSTTAFSLTTAGGQISASGTTITISATDSVTATAGYYEYRLWNTTDDLVIAEGTIRISDGPYGT